MKVAKLLAQPGYMGVKQLIDLMTGEIRSVPEVEKSRDFIKSHPDCTAVSDEAQTLQMALVVDAVVALGSVWLREQPQALVVTHRLRLSPCGKGEFPNLHCCC
jgi:hypothetical protein